MHSYIRFNPSNRPLNRWIPDSFDVDVEYHAKGEIMVLFTDLIGNQGPSVTNTIENLKNFVLDTMFPWIDWDNPSGIRFFSRIEGVKETWEITFVNGSPRWRLLVGSLPMDKVGPEYEEYDTFEHPRE